MNKIEHFFQGSRVLFLASTFTLGASCIQSIAQSPEQTGERASHDLPAKQEDDHAVRDTVIKAGKKAAEIAENVAERTRKGIHAATDDLKKEEDHRTPKNGSNEDESEDEDEAEEKAKDVSDSAKEKASDLYEKGKKKAKKAKDKTS